MNFKQWIVRFVSVLTTLVTVLAGAVLLALPAHATQSGANSFENRRIAEVAATYHGDQVEGRQCVDWARLWVNQAAGRSTLRDDGNARQMYVNSGAVEVQRHELQAGDIGQRSLPDYSWNGRPHTFVVTGPPLPSGELAIVEGNWDHHGSVRAIPNTQVDVPSDHVLHFWRLGQANQPEPQLSPWHEFPQPVSILSRANWRYVSAELARDGASHAMLRYRAEVVDSWEKFQFLGDCRSAEGCAIKSLANGKFVSAELAYGGQDAGMLRARAGSVGAWERFKVSGNCAAGCWIRALGSNKFVSAELGYEGDRNGMLRARARRVLDWERFYLVTDHCPVWGCGIRSNANGKYVSAELDHAAGRRGMLRARADQVLGWERFLFLGNCRSEPGCVIKSLANGKFVVAEIRYAGANNGMLRARASVPTTWSLVRLDGNCIDRCTIRSMANSRFVSAELGYGGISTGMLRGRAIESSAWEEFTLVN